jgi:hypothetical protein
MKTSIVIKGLSVKIEGSVDIQLEEFKAEGEMQSEEFNSYLNMATGLLQGLKDIEI